MPRYQVKDTQESSGAKSASTGSKSSTEISGTSQGGSDSSNTSGGSSNSVTGFRPLYLPNSTQACHCSACVGAVAANVHPVSGEREREREREVRERFSIYMYIYCIARKFGGELKLVSLQLPN